MKLKSTSSPKDIIAALRAAAEVIVNGGNISVELVNGSVNRIALPGIIIAMQNYSVGIHIPATKKVTKYLSAVTFVGQTLSGEFDSTSERDDWEWKIGDGISSSIELAFQRTELEQEIVEEDEA